MAEGEGEQQQILTNDELHEAAEAVNQSLKVKSKKPQNKWAVKHKLLQRYAHEHNKDPDWFKHEKHVLICSWAGRPIFTRYGDEAKLAAYLGVISAIISNFDRAHDTIRSIVAGDYKFVFVLRGPIYLIAISRSSESVAQLRIQLNYTHEQIISLLTGTAHSMLRSSPHFDIRTLMGGTDLSLLSDMIREADREPAFLLDGYNCLRMKRSTRSKVASVIKKSRTKATLYAILLSGNQLIQILQQSKDRPLHPADLLILMNFVSNSQSLRSSESWTPICLPKFSDKGYLYAYVCYIAENLCLLLITTDSQSFPKLRDSKQKMLSGFQKKNCIELIEEAIANSQLDIDELETGVPEFRHFLYKSETTAQIVVPAFVPPFATKKSQKELFRRYQHVHSRIHDTPGVKLHTMYYEVTHNCTMLCVIRPGEYELYATFTPLVSKDDAVSATMRALKWIKREENSLFIL